MTRTSPITPDESPCGCTSGIGPGALAAGVDPVLKDANLKHLRRIEGQVHGIAAMVESDRYCADIITQIAAARASLQSVARNLLRNHLLHCADRAFRKQGPTRDEMIEELLNLSGMVGR